MNTSEKQIRRQARSRRTHAQARNAGHPRLIVFRSNAAITAQIMDDTTGKVVCGVSGLKEKGTGMERAAAVGTKIAELAKTNKVTKVAFDRNGYQYHGQIKSLADAARAAGLEF